ncbi:MAG TPA: hypothetical protein VFK02_05110 [Kofleriaceae bacterium]|nr:hypothetical protein [Kofleriaceae bacterium]
MHSTFEYLLDLVHERSFPDAAQRALPARDTVRALRDAIEAALREPALLVDCVARDLEISAHDRPRVGLVPFHVDERTGIRFATTVWAPRTGVAAHQHAGWTISAVMHNQLEVRTYDRLAACDEGRLVEKNVHAAPAGKAGYIYEPGVHAPWNPTTSWAVSLHVVGPHDSGAAPDGRQFLAPGAPRAVEPGPFDRCQAHWQRQRVLRAQAMALVDSPDPRVPELLERVVALGNTRTRELALSILASIAPARAAAQHALHQRRSLRGTTRLEVALGPPIEREVQLHAGRASLVAWVRGKPITLLRAAADSHEALARLASDEPLRVEELPGLSPGDQIRLAEALDEWGLLRATAEPDPRTHGVAA